MLNFPTQGKISEGTLINILINIHATKFTGTLGLTNGDVKKVISFSLGKPVSSRSNVMDEALGQMLVRGGKVEKDILEQIIKEIKSSDGILVGQALIGKKLITNLELEDYLREQLTNRVKRTLFWGDGDYRIVEGKLAEGGGTVSLDKGIPEIIYAACRERTEIAQLKSFFVPLAVPVRVGGATIGIEELKLVGKELALLRLINGTNTVDKIIKDSKYDEKSIFSFLFSLVSLGLINMRGPAQETAAHAGDPKSATARPAEPKAVTSMSESSIKLLGDIRQFFKNIADKNYFEYLGLDSSATMDAVKNAYFNFAKNYHPDRFPKDFSPEMKKEGEKLFALVTEGYNTLIEQNKRNEYMQKLELEKNGITQSRNQIMESELEFQKGQILLKKGDFDGAVDLLKRAISLYPEEPEYYVHLGWAYFRKGVKSKDPKLISNAKVEIEKGLSRRGDLDKAHLFLGHIAKFENNAEKAKKYYSKAIECNPNNLEASSELRLLSTRDDKGKKGGGSKGIFSR